VREPFIWVMEHAGCPESYIIAAMNETSSGELLDALLRHGCVISDGILYTYMISGGISRQVLEVMKAHHVRFPHNKFDATPLAQYISYRDSLTAKQSNVYHGRFLGQQHMEQLQILISIYDINHADVNGTTPLMAVCTNIYHNDIVLIAMLMKAGADSEKKDNSGRSAIDYLEKKDEPMDGPPTNAECLPWLYFHNMRRLHAAEKGKTRGNGGYNMVELYEFAKLVGIKASKDIRNDLKEYLANKMKSTK